MPYYFNPPPANPLSRLLAALVAVAALVGAFFFGLFILVIVVGLGLIAWLVLSLRLRWLSKKAGGSNPWIDAGDQQQSGRTSGSAEKKGNVIDAEYTVISRRDEES